MSTQPTGISVESFLNGLSDSRRTDASSLITLMQEISGEKPYMWGPSIIGFGSQHYKYETGREGDLPRLAFSPRKASISIYFNEKFDRYSGELSALGAHKLGASCLYINKLADIDIGVLRKLLKQSFEISSQLARKPTTVDQYIASIPIIARPKFDELRKLVSARMPQAKETLSYGIVGYKVDNKRARVFISGWRDHVAIYPVPREKELQTLLAPYIRGKGTLWFGLDETLPKSIITKVVKALAS